MADVLLMRADKMLAAGLPIISVSLDGVSWAEKPTAEQIALADQIAAEIPLDCKEPEYLEKRQARYTEWSQGDQNDAVYHFAKNLAAYIAAGGIKPDANAPKGTPEAWIAWQDEIRQQIPKE